MFDEILGLGSLVDRFPRIFRGEEPRCASHVTPGWRTLIFEAFREIDATLTDANAAAFEVHQIKEKFGTLRLYCGGLERTPGVQVTEHLCGERLHGTTHGDLLGDRVARIVEAAENQSATTCEMCGAPATNAVRDYRAMTRCESHLSWPWDRWENHEFLLAQQATFPLARYPFAAALAAERGAKAKRLDGRALQFLYEDALQRGMNPRELGLADRDLAWLLRVEGMPKPWEMDDL